MRKKILVFCPTLFAANVFFIQHNVFQELTKLYDIYICCNTGGFDEIDPKIFQNKGFGGIFGYTWSAKRRHIWALQLHINTLGGRALSKTAQVVSCAAGTAYGNIIERFVHKIFGASYHISRITNYIFEKYAGIDKNVEKIIDEVKPDLIITFMTGPMPLEIAATKIGKLKKIPVMGIQCGWEHAGGARGQMPHRPDYMGVWGYQSMILAERIQNMPAERIFHLGTTLQDFLKRPNDKSPFQIREELKIPHDKKVLFFVGSGTAYNEVRTLKRLDEAIEEKKLQDCCIFYRPHPYQHRAKNDLNFFEYNFKYVYLDPAMELLYKDAIANNRNFPKKKDSVPVNFVHIKNIFSVSSIMVLSASTLMINGALCGIPSVSMLYTDKENKRFSKAKAFEADEFSLIKGMPGIFMCLGPDELMPACIKALKFCQEARAISAMKHHAAAAIYDDGLTFVDRLNCAIEAILNPESSLYLQFLNRPILNKSENLIMYDG